MLLGHSLLPLLALALFWRDFANIEREGALVAIDEVLARLCFDVIRLWRPVSKHKATLVSARVPAYARSTSLEGRSITRRIGFPIDDFLARFTRLRVIVEDFRLVLDRRGGFGARTHRPPVVVSRLERAKAGEAVINKWRVPGLSGRLQLSGKALLWVLSRVEGLLPALLAGKTAAVR